MTNASSPPTSAVRDATAADASSVASIQSTSWRHDFDWPEEVFAALSAADPEMQWARAVIAPPGPGYRLVVATQGEDVVGYGALAPSSDPDAQVGELEIVGWEVSPDHRRHGHGSRLLAAMADHARAVSGRVLTIWIPAHDEVRRSVLTQAGFGPDGAFRTVAMDSDSADTGAPETEDVNTGLRQVRLIAEL